MLNLKISKNFSQSSKNYENFATIQQHAAKKLVSLVEPHLKGKEQIIDLGSGTGMIGKYLRDQNNQLQITEADISKEMLDLSSNELKICCDVRNLPYQNNEFDLIISSFLLQWIDDVDALIKTLKKALKKDGILALAFPNQKSFKKLRDLNFFHINNLVDEKNLEESLKNNKFEEITIYEEEKIENFDSIIAAAKYFKNIGANYKISDQSRNNGTKILKNYHKYKEDFTLEWNISYFVFSNAQFV